MKNWELKKLGEVCEFEGGSQPPKTVFSYVKKENYIRLIQIRDYKSDNHIVYIPKSKAKRFCNSTDIMIGRYGPPVFQILKGLNGAYNVALMKAVPNEKVLSKDFAFLFLKYSKIQDYIIQLSQRAAGQTGVNKEAIEDYPILLPPLPEQKRIVAILDEAFAALAKAKANAEQNLNNAKELFESYLESVFENKGEGWEEKPLGEVCSIGDGNYSSKYPKASEFVSEGVPFLTATNLKNGTVIPDGIRFISKEQHSTLTKGHIIKGDLVIVVRGSSTGNNSIVPNEYAGSNLNSQLAFLRVKENILSSEYLFAVFNSPAVMKTVKSAISGAAQPQLPNNKLLDIKICYPNIKEQQTIVQKLHALSTKTKKLEVIYQQKINDLEELKKSILQKAFSGELKTKELV